MADSFCAFICYEIIIRSTKARESTLTQDNYNNMRRELISFIHSQKVSFCHSITLKDINYKITKPQSSIQATRQLEKYKGTKTRKQNRTRAHTHKQKKK